MDIGEPRKIIHSEPLSEPVEQPAQPAREPVQPSREPVPA